MWVSSFEGFRSALHILRNAFCSMTCSQSCRNKILLLVQVQCACPPKCVYPFSPVQLPCPVYLYDYGTPIQDLTAGDDISYINLCSWWKPSSRTCSSSSSLLAELSSLLILSKLNSVGPLVVVLANVGTVILAGSSPGSGGSIFRVGSTLFLSILD